VVFALVEDMETVAVHVLIGREAAISEFHPLPGGRVFEEEWKSKN
jgi:hypothetical protein